MSVGLDLASRIGINAREILIVTLAGLESPVLGVVGGIISASDTVENVLTVVSGVGTGGITNLEAENASPHEVMPFDDLLIVGVAAGPSGGVDETTKRVTTEVSAVGVELSSIVVSGEVDEGLVDETNDLDVVRSLHKLNTLKSAGGDETSAVTGLSAPGDFLLFRFSNGSGTFRGSPETEI